MNSKKILITTSSFGKDDARALDAIRQAGYEPALNPFGRKLTEDEVTDLVVNEKPVGMVAGVEPLTEKVMRSAEGLKVISRCGIGMDNVDTSTAKALGIKVFNTPDGPTLSVAELTVGLMLAILRKIPSMDWGVRSGKWNRPMGSLLSKKTVGIIGCGRIGTTVSKLLTGFQCKLLGYDPGVQSHQSLSMTDLDTLLSESDVITIHVPFSDATRHLINADNIGKVKKGAVILNTSRGGIVDEEALCTALKNGHLGGAGLDCYNKEPYTGDLASCDQAVLTCHVGSYARESRIQMERDAVENLLNALRDMETAR
jgi:D-3-phosphoglycerate dehydrogenase